jgi:hypothetical protein
MNKSEDRNVQIVLNAFDTLFNRRDYAAAERFWSPSFRYPSWTFQRSWPAGGMGRRRHRANGGRDACRALGRDSGRGDPGAVAKRSPYVRRKVSRLTVR